ncbi:hypothetical protein T10_13422 [Trichinella papuae]|nr:hypothetical protein T10_13422 [Trichinella papuae]
MKCFLKPVQILSTVVPSALSSKGVCSEAVFSKSQKLITQFWSCFSHMLTCFAMQASSSIKE